MGLYARFRALWQDGSAGGTPITAAALNWMEDGIVAASDHGQLANLGLDHHPQYLLRTDAGAAYVAKAGGSVVQASGPADVPLTLKSAASQTAPVFETQNSDGIVFVTVSATGDLGAQTAALVSTAATSKLLQLRGIAGQSGNLLEAQDSAQTVLLNVSPSTTGRLNIPGFFVVDAADRTAQESVVTMFVGGIGARRLLVGAADSAGAGFRTVRIAN